MNKVLLAALAATLLAPATYAQNSAPRTRRVSAAHVNGPVRHSSGGSSAGASNGGQVVYGTPLTPADRAALPGTSSAMTWATAAMFGAGGGRSAAGGGRGLWGGGGSRRVSRNGSFWGRRVGGDSGGSGSTPPDGSPYLVPSVLMPGQLIRTAGLGALTSQPDAPPSTFAVDAGNRIAYEDSKGYALTTHQGVFTGPKDTLPPPNPTSGSRAGGNGITENNNVQLNNSSSNDGSHGSGGGN